MSHDNSSGAQTASGYRLLIPNVTPDMHVLEAARAYTAAGWYVVPIRRGTKHPGSVVGENWQRKSSRTNAQLEEWWARTDYGIALHVGRSGALVFDVDVPSRVPDILATALTTYDPPFQSTRTNVEHKGHYVFATDGHYGNSPGNLGLAWGEVRGKNGIIVVSPSLHEAVEEGGRYCWLRTGPVPDLPPELAQQLPGTADPSEVATDAEVQMFLDSFTADMDRGLLIPVMQRFDRDTGDGGSRHGAMVTAACWAARESAAGAYPAIKAYRTLRRKFIEVMRRSRVGSDRVLSENQAGAEFDGIWAWAVSQALTADLNAVRDRIEATPRPDRGLGFDPPSSPRTSAEPGGGPGDTEVDTPEPGTFASLLIDATALSDLPDPSPLISTWLYTDTTARLIGAPGSYKSFVALDMACCVALGRPWHGYDTVATNVLYIVGEGLSGYKRRIAAWCEHNDAKISELEGRLTLTRAPITIGGDMWVEMGHWAKDTGCRFIIGDTQSKMTPGMDENSNSDASTVFAHLDALRRFTSGTLMLLHHTGHQNGAAADRGRGASAWLGAVDTELLLTKDEPLVATLRCVRQKDAESDFEVGIAMHAVADSMAVEVTDAVAARSPLWDWIDNAAGLGTTYTGNSLLAAAREDGVAFRNTPGLKGKAMAYLKAAQNRRALGFDPEN